MNDDIKKLEKNTRRAFQVVEKGLRENAASVSKLETAFNTYKNRPKTPPKDGKTPKFGEDFLTPKEMEAIKASLTPKKGTDYFTPSEVEAFLARITPKKGVDYRDGEPGKPGKALTWDDLTFEQKLSLKGDPGAPGRMPKHEWNGTKIRFEHAPGIFGNWHDLQGPPGKTEIINPYEGIPARAGTGATRFSELADVASYKSNAGKVATVNSTEDGLIFSVATSTDEKVKKNASDPTAGYLDDKLSGYAVSLFTNDAGYLTSAALAAYATTSYVDAADAALSALISAKVDGAGAADRVAFWTDADTIDDDSNFIWKNASDRKQLGIQVSDPQASIHAAAAVGQGIEAPVSGSASLITETAIGTPGGSATLIGEPAASSGGSVSFIDAGSGNFTANGTVFYARFYAVLYANGAYYRSQSYLEISQSDPNDSQTYNVYFDCNDVSITGETAQYYVETSTDGSNWTPQGVVGTSDFTYSGQSGSDPTTSWPNFYNNTPGTGPDPANSFDTATQQYGGSNSYYYADNKTILYEIDQYKDIGGTRYVSGTPRQYNGGSGFTDDNSGNYYYVDLYFTLNGTYDGVYLRKSLDGGSSWSYIDIGNTSSYSDYNFADDGTSSARWGQTYSGGSITRGFRVHGYGLSASNAGVYSSGYTDYNAVIPADGVNYIVKHALTSIPANGYKILADTQTSISYGYQSNTADYYDVGYTTWGHGPTVTPNTWGFTGSNQNLTYRIWAMKTIGSTTIESPTYLTLTTSASSGAKYASLSWAAVSGATNYKVQRSVNGGAYTQITNGAGTTLLDDILRSWGSTSSYATTILGTAARFDRATSAIGEPPILAIVNTYGTGTRYSVLGFGVAASSSAAATFQAYLYSNSGNGYLAAATGRFEVYASLGAASPMVTLGNDNFFNNLSNSSTHVQIKGLSNQYLLKTFSPYDTLYLGNYTGYDPQAAVLIQPWTSGDAGLILKGHSSHSDTSILARVEDSAGTYKAYITVGGRFQANTGSVAAPGHAFHADTDTGIWNPTTNEIGVVTGGTERARFHSLGLAIGITSSYVGQIHVKGTATGSINMVIDAFSTQTGDMLRFRNSSATTISSMKSNGYQFGLNTGGSYDAMFTTYNQGGIKGFLMRQSGAQTVDNLEIQNSSGTKIAGIAAGGSFFYGNITGATVPFHAIRTSEQMRLGYDASNYFSTTVGSAGGVSFDAVGSGAKFNFLKRLNLASLASSTTEGDIWADSTQKNIMMFVDGLAQSIVGTGFVQTADQTVTDTVTETTLYGTGIGTRTLPANFFVAGKSVRLKITGVYSTPVGAPSIVFKVKYGSTVIATVTTSALMASTTNGIIDIEVIITCRTTGASGTVMVGGKAVYVSGALGANALDPLDNAGATTTINTTTSNALDVTATWDAASASRIISTKNAIMEILN